MNAPSVVVHSVDAKVPLQLRRSVLALPLRQTVDDPALTRPVLLDDPRNLGHDGSYAAFRSHIVAQIRSIEGLGEDEAVSDTEVGDDVLFDSSIRCRGERHDRYAGVVALEG